MEKKFINHIEISDFEILTDTGWEDILGLYETIEYEIYTVELENGYMLSCADNHIVFDENFNEVFVKNLCLGNKLITDAGVFKITKIEQTGIFENMFDFELPENTNHRYFTNGILSHNTYIAKTVAKMLNVPFAICDATVITQAGYVGEDIESILTRLLQAADYDVERAEKGIVFIDEIDKIGRKSDNPSITRDVGGEGVQQGLLKLLEGSVVNVPPQGGRKHPEQKMIPVDTKNILFICGGAFEGIERKIASRTNKRVIGYQAEMENKNKKEDKKSLLAKVTHEDLRSFGMIPEILGRLPILTYLDELDKKAIRNILTEPKNALVKQYEALFAIDGVKLTFTTKALDYIADKAIERKLGARGLRSIMEDLMNKAMFEMPSSNDKELKIDIKYCKKYLE